MAVRKEKGGIASCSRIGKTCLEMLKQLISITEPANNSNEVTIQQIVFGLNFILFISLNLFFELNSMLYA